MEFKDLTGQKFGRLTVIKFIGSSKKGRLWECECDCAEHNHIIVPTGRLTSGNTKSCGCLHKEQLIARNIFNKKWDIKNQRIYNIWRAIIHRCYSTNDKQYRYYGGKNIKVCTEWLNNYELFQLWALENGYADDLTIDRIDSNKDYCPENCRWATLKEQANNKSNNKFIEYMGEIKTLAQWCEILGLNYHRTKARLNTCHWSVEDAFNLFKYKKNDFEHES